MQFPDATAMANAVKQKDVSPRELVKWTIEKAEKHNPFLNAIVSQRYERALQEARERDFTGKPFAGVPLFLKDLGQEQAGELSTSGSRLLANYRASHSDNYVKSLEALGFIILGRTNTPEFGFKNISDSSLHGQVNLHDDVSRNAGGSSGGAAALVSSGVVTLAAASDGGGSIRIPASFNGLIGLKPTRGRIPVGPTSFRGWQGASVQFALTKTVRDTKRLLYYLQTCQMESPFVLPTLSKESLEQPLKKKLKIAVLFDSPIASRISRSAISAVQQMVKFLEAAGHRVEEVSQPLNGIEAMKSYYIMNSVETAAMFDGLAASLGRPLTLDDMEVMSWALYQSGQKIPAKSYSKILNQWDQYSHRMTVFHEKYDLILTPTTAEVAPKHDQFQLSSTLENKLKHIADFDRNCQQELIWEMFADSLAWTPFTQQANLTGQPAISLPLYRDKQGLSLGVQLTAAKGREDLLLALAQSFEEQSLFV
ncbi:amidase [Streptococcus mutans]|uniref:amidase n=1 Tax=Streptococcus mutans TaxID=1309 RepID=UPI0002B58C03|nr:amidase [Streptococcus mutans]EMC12977.1 amidase [Streptococcus mutans N66]EMC59070.1 amidase [Streptococcus mutans R221]MCB4955129.1 amidase [Streptococcus mutans]MCB5054990.1 amidase [Streptococcus mutans]NLQ72226.1 amidase [Streptococcus mutans]